MAMSRYTLSSAGMASQLEVSSWLIQIKADHRFILFFIPGISDEERFVRKKKNVVTTGISVTKHSQEL